MNRVVSVVNKNFISIIDGRKVALVPSKTGRPKQQVTYPWEVLQPAQSVEIELYSYPNARKNISRYAIKTKKIFKSRTINKLRLKVWRIV